MPDSAAATVDLRIGDIGIALAAADPAMTIRVPTASEPFRAAGGVPEAELTAAWADLSGPPAGELLFDSERLWQLYRQGNEYAFRFTSPTFGVHAFKEARFNDDFTRGQVLLHHAYHDRDAAATPLEYPLDELLFTNLLARGRGVEVHALGLRDADGRGYLFLGHSGAGKTTSARLWGQHEGVLILSDDRIILRLIDGKLWMYGTPWHGEAELAAACRTELHRILVLGRGAKNELLPLAPTRVVSELFTRAFVPFYHGGALGYTLELLQRIADAVPCGELRFVPDARVVDFVREFPA